MASAVDGPAPCPASYNAHYAPFQYCLSTSNPHHRPPLSVATIGRSDQANHQYSLDDFKRAVIKPDLPAVVFLKPSGTQTGHPADSSPSPNSSF